MKLGVDLFNIKEGETGGLVPHLQGVLEALFAGWPEHHIFLFGTEANRNLFPAPPGHVQAHTLPRDGFFPLLDVYASYFQIDVLLRSYPGNFELTFPMARQIVLIPDMQHEFFPEFFSPSALESRRRDFGKTLQDAGAIATNSDHSRTTLLNHAATRCPDIFLMNPALRSDENEADLTAAERALIPTKDYFIYPANLWPHKNHRRVLQAFAHFLEKTDRSVEFVFTGHPKGWKELAKSFPDLPIRHLGFVRRGFLQVLLARARALVFFSLFEGFGMPLLEAFAAGTPVACSNTTSLPEVGGDAVLSCDPTDLAAMSDLMTRLCEDAELRERLKVRGKERLARYSWHASAAQFIEACQRIQRRVPALSAAPTLPLDRLGRYLESVQSNRAAWLKVSKHLAAGPLRWVFHLLPDRVVQALMRLLPSSVVQSLKKLVRAA
jgi:glycosyltransferase involved in cell wall biosynthesis